MSIRTIVEINHDFGHQIERNPEAFLRALRHYINSTSERNGAELERFGVRVAWSGHHSDDRKVVTKFATVDL